MCEGCVAKANYGRLFALQKVELGPAYEPYKSGKLHVQRVFRQDETLPHLFLKPCCKDEPLDVSTNYTALHFSLLALWLGLSLVLLVFYWPKRHDYPLRFRSPRTLLVFWASGALGVTLISITAAAGLTSPCHLYLIVMQITMPISIFYFTIKALQLAFVYNWNWAKMTNKHKMVKRYHRFKYILSDAPYLVGVLVIVLAGTAVHIVEMTSVEAYSPTLNAFSSLRAYWWKIPEEYRVPTGPNGTRGSLCKCWDLFALDAGDTTGAELNTTLVELEASCTNAYLQDCLSNADCRTACSTTAWTSITPPQSCKTWFTNYYSTGACGYPELSPNLSSALFCFGVYRPLFYLYCFLYLFLLLINLALALSVLRMNDQLYMRAEVLFSFFNGVPCVVVILLEGLAVGIAEEIHRFLPNYFFDIILFYYISYTSLFHNIAVPIFLAYYHALTSKFSDNTIEADASLSMRTTSSILDSQRRFPYEEELVFALNSEAACECYTTFAWKEFSVENIKFLQAVKQLVDQSHTVSLYQSALNARRLYHMYIEEDSPFEVNIPSRIRNAVSLAVTGSTCETPPKRFHSRPVIGPCIPSMGLPAALDLSNEMELDRMYPLEENTPDSTARGSGHGSDNQHELEERKYSNVQELKDTQQLLEWFKPAIQEVKSLVLRDSWPRFRKSAFFDEFRELHTQQKSFDDAVGTMLQVTDRRRSNEPSLGSAYRIFRRRNSSSVEPSVTVEPAAISESPPDLPI